MWADERKSKGVTQNSFLKHDKNNTLRLDPEIKFSCAVRHEELSKALFTLKIWCDFGRRSLICDPTANLEHEFKVEQPVGRRLPEVEIDDGGADQQNIVLKHCAQGTGW